MRITRGVYKERTVERSSGGLRDALDDLRRLRHKVAHQLGPECQLADHLESMIDAGTQILARRTVTPVPRPWFARFRGWWRGIKLWG